MYRVLALLLAAGATVVPAVQVPSYAHNRTTMVHLFEWKWNDIADECERFLAPMGYAGVQVSPIQENKIVDSRPWYERYQPISYRWVTRSGDSVEFRSMVKRCNRVGVRIYVDIILNHMTGDSPGDTIGTGGSTANTSELYYQGVPYKRQHFHKICGINNYQDPANVRNCELVGLHDLDQSQEWVRDMMVRMMNDAVVAGVAGFRVDAAKHMWPGDLEVIYSRLKDLNVEHGFAPGTRPFIFQEVIDYGGEAVSKYEYNRLGAVTEFKFGQEISNALRGRNPLKWFANWGEPWGLLPSKDAFVFIDNHDTQRSGGDVPLTHKDSKLYKMAVALMLAHPYGIPRVMSSFAFDKFEQGPPATGNGSILSPIINPDKTCGNGWICEHRWLQIYGMVGFRNYVADAELKGWWDNWANQIAFCRGNRGFIAINADKVDLKQRMHVCLPPGVYCNIIAGEVVNGKCTGPTVRVDEKGMADIEIRVDQYDGILAIHGGAKVA